MPCSKAHLSCPLAAWGMPAAPRLQVGGSWRRRFGAHRQGRDAALGEWSAWLGRPRLRRLSSPSRGGLSPLKLRWMSGGDARQGCTASGSRPACVVLTAVGMFTIHVVCFMLPQIKWVRDEQLQARALLPTGSRGSNRPEDSPAASSASALSCPLVPLEALECPCGWCGSNVAQQQPGPASVWGARLAVARRIDPEPHKTPIRPSPALPPLHPLPHFGDMPPVSRRVVHASCQPHVGGMVTSCKTRDMLPTAQAHPPNSGARDSTVIAAARPAPRALRPLRAGLLLLGEEGGAEGAGTEWRGDR